MANPDPLAQGASSSAPDIIDFLQDQLRRTNLTPPQYDSFEELGKTMRNVKSKLPKGSVKILVTERGEGPLVPPNAIVKLHYAAYWENATIPVYSTLAPDRIHQTDFKLGDGDLQLGLEAALTRVRGPASRFLALLQPVAQWGDGVLPLDFTPPPILFNVWLMGVDTVCRVNFMSSLRLSESEVEITLRQVNAMRQQGEELVACKLFLRAIEIFQQGLTLLSFIGSNPVTRKEEIEEIRVKLFFKLAICYYQVKKPRYILRMLEHVGRFVDVQTVPKALFCYGRAYQMLGQTGMAIKYYEDALKLEPENQAFWNVLSKLRETWQESAENKQSTDQGLSILESTKKLEPVSNEAKYLEATETKIMEIVETRDLKKEELKDLVPTQKIESVPTLEPTEAENMEIIETRDLESTGLKDLKSVEKTDLENEKTIDLKNKDLERTDTNDLETTETIEATGSQATGSQATGLQATGSHATGSQATGSQATGSLASESNALVPTSSEVELLDYDEHDETEELCDFLAALGGKFVLPDGLSNDQVAGAHVLATQFNKLFDQTGKDPKLKFINKPK